MLRATTACTFSTSQLPKVLRNPGALYILSCKRASRHNGVHFFDISTSKSGPELVCFVHFDFEMCGPLLDVAMSKKCTPLWREAHFQVKMYKTHHVRTTFGRRDVEKVHAVVARSTFRSQNVQSTTCSRHFWRFRCRFAWQAQGIVHLVKSDQNVRVL